MSMFDLALRLIRVKQTEFCINKTDYVFKVYTEIKNVSAFVLVKLIIPMGPYQLIKL